MPAALLAALFASLALHVVALWGTSITLPGTAPEPAPLQAELRPLPAAPPPAATPEKRSLPRAGKPAASSPRQAVPSQTGIPTTAAEGPAPATELSQNSTSTATMPSETPPKPLLPASGTIRFALYKESINFPVGRAEHHWEFDGQGNYRLRGMTETSGLVALFKPVRLQTESAGRLTSGGLQPESYRVLRNGADTNESADFDWARQEVRLARDGSVQAIAPGSQDMLSLAYQLAYLPHPENGAAIGVVTGKKYERYALDSLGEEEIVTPAGTFRTLHLRAMTDNVTEIWIALDHYRLPVKIRFTDRKGDTYVQVATETGTP